MLTCTPWRLQNFFECLAGSSLSIEACDNVINRLISLEMLQVKRMQSPVPRRRASFEVKPENAQAAQHALSAPGREPASGQQQRVPSASPSSTIAAETPVFARAAGSRNRVMAAKAENTRESALALPPQGPDALEDAPMEEAESMANVMEGLSLQMGKTSIEGAQEDVRPRRKRHFGLTLTSKPVSVSAHPFKSSKSQGTKLSSKSQGTKVSKPKRSSK